MPERYIFDQHDSYTMLKSYKTETLYEDITPEKKDTFIYND